MTNTHTPGPWTIRPQSVKVHIDPPHRDCFEHIRMGERDFFNVYVSGGHRAERLANAALVAAAPEMLYALKCIHASLIQNATFPADIAYAKAVAAYAIDKAQGEG